MDKRKGVLNVSVSMFFKVATMIFSIAMKRTLIQVCGNDVNGINALYISIIGVLSVTELGVGSAITFCMYKPIAQGNDKLVSALYNLFKKAYTAVGSIILIMGLCLSPFIGYLAKDYSHTDVNLQFTFILMLISIVSTYVFSAKTSLINAYKNDYITTSITSGGIIIQYLLQILALKVTRSFSVYLFCRIIAVAVQWILTEIITRKKYSYVINLNHKEIEPETKALLIRSIKAMFMHNIGYMLVNTVDNIVISSFVGVATLGLYSNYSTILTSLTSILKLVFSSLTSVIGHMYVQEDNNTARRYCDAFHILNFIIGSTFFLGFYAIIDNLVAILFGETLIMLKSVVAVITINGFIQFMRSSVNMFRNATGTFYNDRWKPLAEGIFNLVLSIALVNKIGVTGVIVATILTNLLICHIVEPFVLYKNAFSVSPSRYYFKNYGMIAVFLVSLFLLDKVMISSSSMWTGLFINGFISVAISLAVSAVVVFANLKNIKILLKK